MALSGVAIFGTLLLFIILGLLGYVGYRYYKDKGSSYNKLTDQTTGNEGTCSGTGVKGSSVSQRSAALCEDDCDNTKGCLGYEWNNGCTLYTDVAPSFGTVTTGAECRVRNLK